MMKSILSILGLALSIQILLMYPCTHAWVIHILQKRSVDGQPEIENNVGAVSETEFEGQGFARQSQVNYFRFLLPFWWHYLRPMLNIFATNNNFRQTLQKEYEYEIEHGSLNEIESQETENSQTFEQPDGSEFEFAGHEVEQSEIEHEQAHENSFETENVLNEENGRLDIEHITESNNFTPFDSERESSVQEEQESNIQEHAELPEFDTMIENTQLREDNGNTEEAQNVGDFGMESEKGFENQEWENSEEENRRLFLTGNIVGSFTNSLKSLMPTLWDQEISEHEKQNGQFNAFAQDEFEMTHPGWEQSADGTLEMNGDMPNSESENVQASFNINPMLNNNFGNQITQGEDIGDRSPRSFGFQHNEIEN